MKRSSQRHSIENVFVLVLFAIFAMTIVAVLALGANQYKSLVERDNNAYNKELSRLMCLPRFVVMTEQMP